MSSVARVHIRTEKGFAVLFRLGNKKNIAQLPGGVIETGETRRDCAIRELMEEVSLPVQREDLIFISSTKLEDHTIDFLRLKREIIIDPVSLCVPENEKHKFLDGKVFFFNSFKELLSFCLEKNFRLGWGMYDFLDIHEKWDINLTAKESEK